MLWNLTISAAGISVLVQHSGVSVVLEVMRMHAHAEEVQQNALGVLRNISDAPEGQSGILRAGGLPLLLETLTKHARYAPPAFTQARPPMHPSERPPPPHRLTHVYRMHAPRCDEIVELSLECLANVAQASMQHGIALMLEGGIEALHAPPLLISATPLRRRLALTLEPAAPFLGALLHTSSTSEETRTSLVLALALFTLPPAAPANLPASQRDGAAGSGRNVAAAPFWPLGGPAGWQEDAAEAAAVAEALGVSHAAALDAAAPPRDADHDLPHLAGRGASAAARLAHADGDEGRAANSPSRRLFGSGSGGGVRADGSSADDSFIGAWAVSLLLDEGGLAYLLGMLSAPEAAVRSRAAVGVMHLLSVSAVAEPTVASGAPTHGTGGDGGGGGGGRAPGVAVDFVPAEDGGSTPDGRGGGGRDGTGRQRRGVLPGGWRAGSRGGAMAPAGSPGRGTAVGGGGARPMRGPRLSPRAASAGIGGTASGTPGSGGKMGGGGGKGGGADGAGGGAAAGAPSSASGRLHDFAGWLDDEETSDVLFEIDGQTLHAHRIVLCCSRGADVFRAMLRHPMREAATAAVKVDGIQYEVFRLLVTYLYTGEAHVPPHLAAALLLACERYME